MNHLARFGVSFLLAVLLWGWVTEIQDPLQSRRFTELAMQPPGLSGTIQIVSSLPRVTVSVSDVESRLESLDRNDLSVTLDVSEIDGPGTFQVPVEVTTDDEIRSIEVSPDTVSIQVEEEVSKVFPLIVDNQAANSNRIVDVIPDVTQVTVRGTQSAVDRVERVVLPVNDDGQTSDFTMLFEPIALGEDNQRVQEVSIDNEQVRTFVALETRGKTVSIVPQIEGVPAAGFTVQQTIALPATIIIDGPEESIESILFLDTQPVDISDATESLSEDVALEPLPEGVTLIEPSTNRVEVRVSIGTSTGTPHVVQGMPVEVRNNDDGFKITVDPELIDLSVSAPSGLLSSLTPEDFEVSVDVAGLGPGVYSLTPDVTLPPEVSANLLDPQSVTVLISDVATPEATPGARTAVARSASLWQPEQMG